MDLSKNILIVVSNVSELAANHPTGIWLEEFAVPYLGFKKADYDVTVASPEGGLAPIDEASIAENTPEEWKELKEILENTKKLDEVDYENFAVIFIPGGHGPLIDLANNNKLAEIVNHFYINNKIISAICHGIAGLLGAKKTNGDAFVKGKKLTALTNEEEKLSKKHDIVPFLLEDRLKELGANFETANPWTSHVIIDDNLITGQNPQSSELLTESILITLEELE